MDRAGSRIALAGRALCLVLPPAIWFAPVAIEPTAIIEPEPERNKEREQGSCERFQEKITALRN